MDIKNCKRKLKRHLDKVFRENFELSRYYSENLVKYLDDAEDKHTGKILDTSFVVDIIKYSEAYLENATTSVKILIAEIITIIVKDELQFTRVVVLDGFTMMVQKIQKFDSFPPVALHLASIKCTDTQISHYTGVMWVVQNKVWTNLLLPNIHQHSEKVAQAIYDCISKLVWKLNEYDEEPALIEVLAYVIEPLRTSEYLNSNIIDAENEKALYEPMIPNIHTIIAIVTRSHNCPGPKKVLTLLQRYFIVEPYIYTFLNKTRNSDFACTILCEFEFNFMLAVYNDHMFRGINAGRDITNEIISEYYNMVVQLLDKRMAMAAMSYVVKSVVIWAKANTNSFPDTFERNGRTFDLKNQFTLLILAPIVTYIRQIGAMRNHYSLLEEIDAFAVKGTKMYCEHIVNASYVFKELVENGDGKKIVLHGLRQLLNLRSCLNDAQAGVLYQALYYALRLHVTLEQSGFKVNENILKTPDDVKLLSLVLSAIKMLLKEHVINWYESIEIICLQTTLMDLLKQNFLPVKQLLQVIDLIDLSINKFLSPDMALLVESRTGSTLTEVGAAMKTYIQHEEWEVRDSALHLLLSCIDVAFVKYFPLRKLMSENHLIILAAHAALNDKEFYVQTTALTCLAAATKIDSLWREVLLAHPNLYNQLIFLLRQNSEGIVRKEVANVLTEIYLNQKLCKDYIKSLYNVMATAALDDLHWEVQIAALNFWKNVIQNLLSNRGMIDGKFPAVTFSKEKRKIIILNEKEIKNQLVGIMSDLSDIACLTVLYKCLNDDEVNLDVMLQAYCIAKDLVQILETHKFEAVPNLKVAAILFPMDTYNTSKIMAQQDVINQDVDEAMDLTSASHADQEELREKIIEAIVNSTDYDLIVACYEKHTQINSDDEDKNLTPTAIVNMIDPNVFLKKIKKTDYVSIIEGKKKWRSETPGNLDVLLDEILDLI